MRKYRWLVVFGVLFALGVLSFADGLPSVYTETRPIGVGFNIVTSGPDANGNNHITITNGDVVRSFVFPASDSLPPMSLTTSGGMIKLSLGFQTPHLNPDGQWVCCYWYENTFMRLWNGDGCDGDLCSGVCCVSENQYCIIVDNQNSICPTQYNP